MLLFVNLGSELSNLPLKWNIYQLWKTLNKRLNHFNRTENEDLSKKSKIYKKIAKKTKTVKTHRETHNLHFRSKHHEISLARSKTFFSLFKFI